MPRVAGEPASIACGVFSRRPRTGVYRAASGERRDLGRGLWTDSSHAGCVAVRPVDSHPGYIRRTSSSPIRATSLPGSEVRTEGDSDRFLRRRFGLIRAVDGLCLVDYVFKDYLPLDNGRR